jgi:ABC-type multidrug transport system fused ATPase/permease subunit
MEVLRKGRTMVVVAHRLSSILKANTIFFLSEGRLIAQGSHESLYENLLVYRQLVDQQFPAGKGGRA